MILVVDDNDAAGQALIKMIGSADRETIQTKLGEALAQPRRLSVLVADLKFAETGSASGDASPPKSGESPPRAGMLGGAEAHAVRPSEGDAGLLDRFIGEQLAAGADGLYEATLQRLEKHLLMRVLQYTGGNQSRAAEILGITRGSLRYKLRHRGVTIRAAL